MEFKLYREHFMWNLQLNSLYLLTNCKATDLELENAYLNTSDVSRLSF